MDMDRLVCTSCSHSESEALTLCNSQLCLTKSFRKALGKVLAVSSGEIHILYLYFILIFLRFLFFLKKASD